MGGTSTDGRFIVWSCVSTAPCGGSGKCVAGWFEVETRYWVVRLHAAPRPPGFLVRRGVGGGCGVCGWSSPVLLLCWQGGAGVGLFLERSEEHTSELQSRGHLVCRLLL